jgi:hypothetical protein
LAELLFIGFNILDAYLTRIAIGMGCEDWLPWVRTYGSSMLAKGLIATVVVILLHCFGRGKWLWWMNFVFFGACVWNFWVCAFGHLVGEYPWA